MAGWIVRYVSYVVSTIHKSTINKSIDRIALDCIDIEWLITVEIGFTLEEARYLLQDTESQRSGGKYNLRRRRNRTIYLSSSSGGRLQMIRSRGNITLFCNSIAIEFTSENYNCAQIIAQHIIHRTIHVQQQ